MVERERGDTIETRVSANEATIESNRGRLRDVELATGANTEAILVERERGDTIETRVSANEDAIEGNRGRLRDVELVSGTNTEAILVERERTTALETRYEGTRTVVQRLSDDVDNIFSRGPSPVDKSGCIQYNTLETDASTPNIEISGTQFSAVLEYTQNCPTGMTPVSCSISSLASVTLTETCTFLFAYPSSTGCKVQVQCSDPKGGTGPAARMTMVATCVSTKCFVPLE